MRYGLDSYNKGHFQILCLLYFLRRRIISYPFSESNPGRNRFAVRMELVDEIEIRNLSHIPPPQEEASDTRLERMHNEGCRNLCPSPDIVDVVRWAGRLM
jgi:hypothetical protein